MSVENLFIELPFLKKQTHFSNTYGRLFKWYNYLRGFILDHMKQKPLLSLSIIMFLLSLVPPCLSQMSLACVISLFQYLINHLGSLLVHPSSFSDSYYLLKYDFEKKEKKQRLKGL